VALPDALGALHLARHTELLLRNWGGSVKHFMQARYVATQQAKLFQCWPMIQSQQVKLEAHAEHSVSARPDGHTNT